MKPEDRSAQVLRDELERFQSLLKRGPFFSISSEEKDALLVEAQKVLRKLDGIAEGLLTVGLIGGTGVGKSSIMNALADSEIASTSHRRPHTDHVLIYHFKDVQLPQAIRDSSVLKREITHQANAVKQLLLCDLPDFDSLVGAHRKQVVHFTEHLDVLVWVTSPEKYADERFYEFLREVRKAKQNYYFVLNKCDLFFHEKSLEVGYQKLAKVIEVFQRYLTENGVEHPLIYSISAADAMESHHLAPWNQFASFRHHIFQHREIKEIMAIKTANIDVEARQLLSVLDAESMKLEALDLALNTFIEEFEADRKEWVAAGCETLETWLENQFKKQVVEWMADSSAILGPGRMVHAAAEEWQRLVRRDDAGQSPPNPNFDDLTLNALKRQFERLENKIIHRLLQGALPFSFVERVKHILAVHQQWGNFTDRFEKFLQVRFLEHENASFFLFRGLQFIVYLLLFVLLLLALGGERSWKSLLEAPSITEMLGLLSSMARNLFAPAGLAALLSYFCLNAFCAFRFYRFYKKILQRRAQRFIDALKLEIRAVLEEQVDSIINQLSEYRDELNAQRAALSALRARKEGVG